MNVDYNAHTDLGAYSLQQDRREQLFTEQIECSLVWIGKDGWPTGVINWYVWKDGCFWVSCGAERPRVDALRAKPESCVIVSGLGAPIGPGITASAKTLATVHSDPAIDKWFLPALAERGFPADRPKQTEWLDMLKHTPRVAIQLKPVKWISLDSSRLYEAVGWEKEQG